MVFVLGQPDQPTGKTWTCHRQSGGEKCGVANPVRLRKCIGCGKPRPAKRKPKHLSALDESYEHYVALNDGVEECFICHAKPKNGRRLHRDHDHAGEGSPRGLLCFRCNAALRNYMTGQWLRRAAYYLERHADRQREAA